MNQHATASFYPALRRADQNALILLAIMIIASFVITSMSSFWELRRVAPEISWRHPFLNEGSSHLAIFILAFLLPFVVDRTPVGSFNLNVRAVAIHLAAFGAFSICHVGAMLGIRSALFPIFVGYDYGINLFDPSNFIYELRKDAFTYALIAICLYGFRELDRKAVDALAEAARARDTSTITLRSGGTAFVTTVSDVVCASAAGNYVEVVTVNGSFLARLTLTRLAQLLSEAGGDHVRIHRSHLVSPSRVIEVAPDGEGGIEAKMDNGKIVPCSRGYRGSLLSALSLPEPANASRCVAAGSGGSSSDEFISESDD